MITIANVRRLNVLFADAPSSVLETLGDENASLVMEYAPECGTTVFHIERYFLDGLLKTNPKATENELVAAVKKVFDENPECIALQLS